MSGSSPDEVGQGDAGQGAAGAALEVKDLHVSYGSAKALFGLDLSVRAGSVLAVLGPNGAGKSTFGRAVAGLIPAQEGVVELDGRSLRGVAPHAVRRAGLAYIPEGRGIFPGLSVIDNLRMAARVVGDRSERRAAIDRAVALFPILGSRQKQLASSLSGGEQQMLALGRALSTRPRLVVADEMSLGLAPLLVNDVFAGLAAARSMGITIVLIEQFVHRALTFADDCTILSRGRVGWAGPAGEAGPEVIEHYLGGSE
ncbi:ABC transporter ATP-binding protein [Pseudonocardia sp. GCM10023141]|uniref:ABC transporter ATP-binding protein n=1 Tax=Pseudonocardia sp. GCM10023141 TaxID=3252653 RepID=UPI00361C5759